MQAGNRLCIWALSLHSCKITWLYSCTNLVHDDFALSRLCHVNHSLDNVVGVLVLHHGVQGAVGSVFLTAHFIYQQSSLCTWRMDHTLFHNITGGKKKRERVDYTPTHNLAERLAELVAVEAFYFSICKTECCKFVDFYICIVFEKKKACLIGWCIKFWPCSQFLTWSDCRQPGSQKAPPQIDSSRSIMLCDPQWFLPC